LICYNSRINDNIDVDFDAESKVGNKKKKKKKNNNALFRSLPICTVIVAEGQTNKVCIFFTTTITLEITGKWGN